MPSTPNPLEFAAVTAVMLSHCDRIEALAQRITNTVTDDMPVEHIEAAQDDVRTLCEEGLRLAQFTRRLINEGWPF